MRVRVRVVQLFFLWGDPRGDLQFRVSVLKFELLLVKDGGVGVVNNSVSMVIQMWDAVVVMVV